MSRSLLAKSRLNAFKVWLSENGIEHRPGKDLWQVLQVKVGNGWQCVFDRIEGTVHYTVAQPLESTVRKFIKDTRHDQAN